MTALWDTTGSDVVKALAAERRAAGAIASSLVLNLVAVVDERNVSAAEVAATTAASAHPCRMLVVVRRQPDGHTPRLDAEVTIGGRLGPGEAVILRMYGRLALHAESVVLPLLASDAPVVTWWYGEPPQLIGTDPLGVLADRRVTDCAAAADPVEALRRRAADYAPGDTDLAWARTTPWRSLLASAFDSMPATVRSGAVSAEAGNPSAVLLAGWLRHRTGAEVTVAASRGPGVSEVLLQVTDASGAPGTVGISRSDGRTGVLSRSGHPDASLPLPRRELGDLLAEELKRLDADEPYAEALASAVGVDRLPDRPRQRSHVWRDPATPDFVPEPSPGSGAPVPG